MRHDRRAEDSILPTFMFVAVFLVGAALLISLMTSLFAEARRGDWDVLENYQIIGGVEYVMFDPSDGYPVTSANLSLAEDFDITVLPDAFVFTSDAARDIRAWVINDNSMFGQRLTVTELSKTLRRYQDMFVFRMSWGYWSYDMDAISYEQVISDQQGGTNMSVSVFYLAGDSYSLLVSTGGDATTHESLIWNNQFNISIGHDTSTIDTVTSASFWSILGQMMSASLPNTHWIINYLVSAIMWSAIGFMAIVVIVWFIPF